jgi:hypothetical protein
VGGYPLPPDFGSRANSVKQAISAFGLGVALASIKLDAFRTHFISKDEASNLLVPLEYALKRKRQTVEMD